MGKASDRRIMRRQKFLSRLAQVDPDRFDREWAKRIDSWTANIWAASKDRVFLENEEYKKIILKYPHAKALLDETSADLYSGFHIYLNVLDLYKEELGGEVVSAILKYAKNGTLLGSRSFTVVDHAMKILTDCGDKAVERQSTETSDILNNECCRALATHVGDRKRKVGIYAVNQDYTTHAKYCVRNGRTRTK